MRKIISEDGLVLSITEQDVLCNEEKIEYIDKGEEGIVYRYQDKAIKIYHNQPKKIVISLKLLEELKKIDLKRIINPIEILFAEDNLEYIGYITKYINGDKDSIYEYKKEKLLKELDYINEDLERLGKENIIIGDLRYSNYLSNITGMYLLDFGDYDKSIGNVNGININKREFEHFFFYDLLFTRLKQVGLKEKTPYEKILGSYRKERYRFNHDNKELSMYLDENMNEEENLNNYAKRLIKQK